ncbi:hypothetical protein ACP4OV_020635 [Aristida adscensionis]
MGFAVRRTSRSYVRPSAATPSGSLELSAVDRLLGHRFMVRSLHVFAHRHEPLPGGEHPPPPRVVIREALGKALVDYYPFAGRLVDGPKGPATARVECTGEGAWFVDAVAGGTLQDAGLLDKRPFAVPEADLLPDAAPGVDPRDIPLMMQVTEFACGGFVVGLMSSHAMTDGLGAGQFLNAVADYARGLPKPRVTPVWARELVPSLPEVSSPPAVPWALRFRYLTVDLSRDGVDKVKSRIMASTGQRCSTFDVVVAKVWQARTRALRLPDPSTRVTLTIFANARHLLPKDGAGAGAAGFYGNCYYPATAAARSGEVEAADVASVVRMVREAKARLPGEVARWAAGGLAREENPFYEPPIAHEALFVSEWTRLGFAEVDYGWGTPSHVVPFAAIPCMPVALIGAPPAPGTGVRITTQCVEEESMPAFREEMEAFEK